MAMRRVASFDDLEIYKRAFELPQGVFRISTVWPKAEHYSLTDQIRRASRSIGANIAEAWAKRRHPAHFRSKLTDADGEQNETCHWLKTALACEYITKKEHQMLVAQCHDISRTLGRTMADAEQWTPRR